MKVKHINTTMAAGKQIVDGPILVAACLKIQDAMVWATMYIYKGLSLRVSLIDG